VQIERPSKQIVQSDPKKLSREIGVEIASLCGKHFLKIKHIHYGYWPKDLELDITNLRTAQERYTDFLLSNIPKDVNTIIDVGCGSGQTAKRLSDAGFDVDCVSPSPLLAQETRDLLGKGHEIYESYYEQLQTEKRYDLVLFSESFQYMDMEIAIKKTLELLNNGGYLLICDIFKTDTKEHGGLISGGHRFSAFNKTIAGYPFVLSKDVDITEYTAPNIDLENKLFMEAALPALGLLDQLLSSRYPLITRFMKWKNRKKIDKIHTKYFSGKRTGENFKKFKSYHLLIYKKTSTH